VLPPDYYFVDVESATGAAVVSTATESVATAVESVATSVLDEPLPQDVNPIVNATTAANTTFFIVVCFKFTYFVIYKYTKLIRYCQI
jgi:hypothetical protein